MWTIGAWLGLVILGAAGCNFGVSELLAWLRAGGVHSGRVSTAAALLLLAALGGVAVVAGSQHLVAQLQPMVASAGPIR